MKNVKIFNRLITAFTILLVMAVILGALGIVSTTILSNAATDIYKVNMVGIEHLGTVSKNFVEVNNMVLKIALGAFMQSETVINKNKPLIPQKVQELEARLAEFGKTLENSENDVELKKIKTKYDEFYALKPEFESSINDFIAMCDKIVLDPFSAENLGEFNVQSAAIQGTIGKIGAVLDELVAMESKAGSNANDSGNNLQMTFTVIEGVVLLIIVVFSLIIAFVIASSIERKIKDIIKKISSTTRNIADSTNELNESSENLANGSSRQAASIEETSATMNESASMVQLNAENTRQAAQLAKESNELALQSMKKMDEMVISMDQIKESSDTISRIVKVIDDIAFQTNLLAINATVEAARAGGDAGRSFAVVAEEVRNLAQRSAKAASDTTDIIEKNISLTANGRDVSRNVAESLKEITHESEQLNRIINEINAASEEQATGIKQINIAITQMEKVTQDNAAVAEENAASSNRMKDEIEHLHDAINIATEMIRE